VIGRGGGEARGVGLRPRSRVGWWYEFPDDPEMRVSHETIYVSLFVQSRGAVA